MNFLLLWDEIWNRITQFDSYFFTKIIIKLSKWKVKKYEILLEIDREKIDF